eukprot:752932-Hanusia_phi.AAC.2
MDGISGITGDQNALSKNENSTSAENGFFAKLFAEGIEGISPLPWPYRQHLMCSIPDDQNSEEEQDHENIQLSFSAANCIAALTGASAASAYVISSSQPLLLSLLSRVVLAGWAEDEA